MIQGEPLTIPADEKSDAMDAAPASPALHVPHADRSTVSTEPVDSNENPAEAMHTATAGQKSGVDTLDSEVQNLLNALATEEFGHDEAWVEVSQAIDSVKGDALPDDLDNPLPYSGAATIAESAEDSADIPADATSSADSADHDQDDPDRGTARWMSDDDFAADIAADISPDPSADSIPEAESETRPEAVAEVVADTREDADELNDAALPTTSDLSEESLQDDTAPGLAAQAAPAVAQAVAAASVAAPSNEPSAEMLGLKAIDLLGEKIAASEDRYDSALNKMGHALGVIAQRIDSLESRMTDQTIANVALAAAPPEIEDHSVAPYIARAERELKARNRKESGPMDIFDRIAQAAENEFDDRPDKGETKVLANSSDGRRVGTKKWQPSKTVKRRMEQLEKSRADTPADNGARPAARPQQDATQTAPTLDPEDFAAQRDREEKAAPEPIFDLEEEDDSGLSILPGARGRRRNRARKSRLDEDFENVFEDEGGQPSIKSLRRKMRDRPAEDPEMVEPAKGGMLSGLLSKKSSRKAAPVAVDDAGLDTDEEDLLAAFDDPGEEVVKAPKHSKKSKHVDIDEEDDDDEWDDEDTGAGSRRKPLLYALIAAAAGAGFFAWKTFLG